MPPKKESSNRHPNNANQNQQREYGEHTGPAPAFSNRLCSFHPLPVEINYNSLPH
jgi:hypothetical protein